MRTEDETPKPRRPRPASRELQCGICGQSYVYPAKGENATRRLCVECAALPASVSQTMLRMGGRIRSLEKELRILSEKLKSTPSPQTEIPHER